MKLKTQNTREKTGKLEGIKQRLLEEELRKRTWRKEKEAEEAKMIIREAERVERKEKQRVLEERWKLIRWLAEFIDTNRERSKKKGKR